LHFHVLTLAGRFYLAKFGIAAARLAVAFTNTFAFTDICRHILDKLIHRAIGAVHKGIELSRKCQEVVGEEVVGEAEEEAEEDGQLFRGMTQTSLMLGPLSCSQ
jgi:hypothetical protein